MSRTRRRKAGEFYKKTAWLHEYLEDQEDFETRWLRGLVTAKDLRSPEPDGGWSYLTTAKRKTKRYAKRINSKYRRREAKRKLKQQYG